jgi:hypothetical protein
MAFWSKPKTRLLTPEIVAPISSALASIPHTLEWSIYDTQIEGEQIIFCGEHAKIHIWSNFRDHAVASIMRPETDGFEASSNVVLLEMLLDYNDQPWEDFRGRFSDLPSTMSHYGEIVEKHAMPFFLGRASFETLIAFNRGFECAYTGHFSGRFS